MIAIKRLRACVWKCKEIDLLENTAITFRRFTATYNHFSLKHTDTPNDYRDDRDREPNFQWFIREIRQRIDNARIN